MIYCNTIQKRTSSSSEEEMDTSDEFIHALSFKNSVVDKDMPEDNQRRDARHRQVEQDWQVQQPQPSCSGYVNPRLEARPQGDLVDKELTPEQEADQQIQKAEAAKARIFPP